MTTIELTRGEFLHLRITFADNGTTIADPEGDGYTIKAVRGATAGGAEVEDLGATFIDGQGAIDYDTTDITADFFFDVRLSLPSGEQVWSDTYRVHLTEPNTKPA